MVDYDVLYYSSVAGLDARGGSSCLGGVMLDRVPFESHSLQLCHSGLKIGR